MSASRVVSHVRRAHVDLQAAGGVDPARLERSLGLRVRRTGPGRYRVWGGKEEHWVDLYTRRMPRCDCGDHIWREKVCKHILAVMLREGDERVIAAVGGLVSRLRAEASERGDRRRPRGAGPGAPTRASTHAPTRASSGAPNEAGASRA